jgi:hypothetical protein
VLGDQVVHPVVAWGWLSEQVMLIQSLQALAGSGQAGAVKGCGGVRINAGSGVQCEPAEQPLLFCRQVLVGQVERGRCRQVLGGQVLQPVNGGCQFRRPAGYGPGRVMVELPGDHGDRQWQESAQPDDLPDPRIGGAETGLYGQPDQQVGSFAGRQDVKADRGRVVQRG